MSNIPHNQENVIDSLDILARIEQLAELQSEMYKQLDMGLIAESDMLLFDKAEGKELDTLQELAEQCEGYGDWSYGEQLIHRDYFEQYMDDMVADCYDVPVDLPYWMTITLDYKALEEDYMSVDFDGQEYLMRCV